MTAPAIPSTQAGEWGYRPALDGLRSVAVYLVIAFHAGVVAWDGGFIGVDLFFVLSGFLVTSVLIAEHARSGRISLGRFYARRVRRLLPAAVVTIVAIAVIAVFVEPPLTRAGHVSDARSALLYVSNWHFVREATDYFAADVHGSPYLHFWSLSVEEQFYLAFPLVLMGLFALARRIDRPVAVLAGIAVLLAAGVVTQILWADRDPLRAYYGTDARVYQMLAGALLALVLATGPGRESRRDTAVPWRRLAGVTSIVGLAALVVTATDAVDWSPSTRGFVATAAAVTTIVSLEYAPAGPLGWLLSRHPLVYLGRISYSTYLWHWPIIVFTDQIIDLSPVAMTVLAAVGATALASLSYVMLETPVRTSRSLARFPWPVVATGLATSILVAAFVMPAILDNDRRPVVDAAGTGDADLIALADQINASATSAVTTTIALTTTTSPPTTAPAPATTGAAAIAPATSAAGSASTTAGTTTVAAVTSTTSVTPAAPTTTTIPLAQQAVPPDLDLAAAAEFRTGQFSCVDGAPEDCILEHGSGPVVFVLGDSNAAMLMPMFRELAKEHDFTLAATTAAGCTWQRDVGWEVDDQTLVDTCVATRNDAYDRVIPALHPDVVVTMHVSRDDPARPTTPFTALDASLGTGDEIITNATTRSLDALEATGARVLLIEPVPYGRFNTVDCLSGVDLVIDCAFQTGTDPSPTEVAYRSEAEARPSVFDADIDPLTCPNKPLCMPIVNGELMYRDALHVFPPWLVEHRDEIWATLTATGALG